MTDYMQFWQISCIRVDRYGKWRKWSLYSTLYLKVA